ncbi:hypothetical protein VA7868_03710 [Vibrio aerogenes CECT 7868]|uniref:Uncharacterized protein n=1 Tax=Vibrio aerogenes CECT 7868 TaxID=1216006 RepID=A0A1M6B4T9_9VIBR|nr:hypothetical protein [Vibrio aerogenes]SHI43751.1 hypothetical protein VA7868_03710 [Vibrio aerogenes CECT 7868]
MKYSYIAVMVSSLVCIPTQERGNNSKNFKSTTNQRMNRHDVCSKFFSPRMAIKIGPVPRAFKPKIKRLFRRFLVFQKPSGAQALKAAWIDGFNSAPNRSQKRKASGNVTSYIAVIVSSLVCIPTRERGNNSSSYKTSQINEQPKDEQTRRLFKIFIATDGDKNWSCPARV